ncbi:MAG: hypothetical protein J6B29_04995 [Clostridia bacterium]|nr:hypothetical protein [Clostridia bacterium]
MRGKKKNIILISTLSVILIALILVYAFVVAPLLEEAKKQNQPPEIFDGEGLYLNTMVTVYPEIDEDDVVYIEVTNEHGTYAFHSYLDMTSKKQEMRLKDLEKLDYDKSVYAMLLAYTRLPVSYLSNEEKNAPMRGLDSTKMAEYGCTEDTYRAKYTIGYKDSSRDTKYHTVYIGHPTFTDDTTYYVALEGRNTVYRFHQEGVEQALFASMESYLAPIIFQRFSNAMTAMATITKFKIGVTNPDRLGQDDYIRDVVTVLSKGMNEDNTSMVYELVYKSLGTGNTVKTTASADKLNTVFKTLYCYFAGESVVCVRPNEEQLKAYGLDAESRNYYVVAQLSDDEEDTYTFLISEEINGYYYTLSNVYGDDSQMLVKIPASSLSFLSTEEETVYSWADTGVTTLFFEYLVRNDDAGEPGMKSITLRMQKRNDKTGEIEYNTVETFKIVFDGRQYIKAIAQSSGRVYDSIYEGGNIINQFANLYELLVFFPKPNTFNNMTQAEIDSLRNDDGAIVFEIEAENNDNELFKYTYYQIDRGVRVMVEEAYGRVVGGEKVWEESKIRFNASLNQIDILRQNFRKLLDGEILHPEDYIY